MQGAVFIVDSENDLVDLVKSMTDRYLVCNTESFYEPSLGEDSLVVMDDGPIQTLDDSLPLVEDSIPPQSTDSLGGMVNAYANQILDRATQLGIVTSNDLEGPNYTVTTSGHIVEVGSEPFCTAKEIGYPKKQKLLYLIDADLIPGELEPFRADSMGLFHGIAGTQNLASVAEDVCQDLRRWLQDLNKGIAEFANMCGLYIMYKIVLVSDSKEVESRYGLESISRGDPQLRSRIGEWLQSDDGYISPT